MAKTSSDAAKPHEPSWDMLERQQAVVALGRRAVAAPDPALLLQDAAALIAEMVGADSLVVGEVDAGSGQLALSLSVKQSDGKMHRAGENHVALDSHQSLAGYVLQAGHPIAVDDLASDSRFQDHFLSRQGVRGALAVPLCLPHRAFGALVVGCRGVRLFDPADLLFAETVAHVVTTAVARCRVEQALAAERRLSAGMLRTVEAIVLVLDGSGHIVHVNEACERITGLSLDAIRRRPVCEVLPVADELDLFKSIFDGLRQGMGPVQFESHLLTKHSKRRRIAWSYNTVCGADGEVESILATGIDVTPQQAVREDHRAETPAEVIQPQADRPVEPQLGSERSGTRAGESQIAASSSAAIPEERRRRPRRSYPYLQLIAPVVGGELPDPSEFYQVQCNDIAAGGFSYMSPKPPESAAIVVALGTPPALTYLHAQIAHANRIRKDGKWMYLVGCSYTGRAFY